MNRDFKAYKPLTSENKTINTEKSVETKSVAAEASNGEIGGPTVEVDPTKFGDWSVNGRCVDF